MAGAKWTRFAGVLCFRIVTALSQSVFDNDVTVYAYIGIEDGTGGRTLVEKVAVCNDIGSVLALGQRGRFYVDRLLRRETPSDASFGV